MSEKARRPPGIPDTSRAVRFARTAARLFLAAVFIYASLDKIAHPAAFAKDVYNYLILPDALINLTALVLPWFELFLGLCLLVGFWLPGAVAGAAGLLVVFTAAFAFNLARGVDVNCGCFATGAGGPALWAGWYLLRDIAFLAVALFLWRSVFRKERSGPQLARTADPIAR